jgi:two-component system NarL family sensor kinase
VRAQTPVSTHTVLAALEDRAADRAEQVTATRALALLRVLLLPIVFAGDRLVAHPKVGTADFDLVFAATGVYAALMLVESWRRQGPRLPPAAILACDLVLVGALTYESGGAFSQLRAAFLALPLGAALLVSPRRTAAVSVATAVVYVVVAVVHPATSATKRLDVALTYILYVVWVGGAAIMLSTLLSRRRQRILGLAVARGRLVAQAVDAEERARKRLADGLHDTVIQNLLVARADLAEARDGDTSALIRAEHTLRIALEQLRSTVRSLHPYLLDHVDLPSALEAIAEQHAVRGSYRVEVSVDPAAAGAEDKLVMSLASELLTNAARHADASRVTVTLTRDAGAVILEVSDDGRGFGEERRAAAIREGHIGLAASRERVEATGGRFEIESEPGAGARVRCAIPAVPNGLSIDRMPSDRMTKAAPYP